MKKITPNEVNWKSVGRRLLYFREMLELDRRSFADSFKIPFNQVVAFESGQKRKSLGAILDICYKCKLNVKWLLTGNGFPYKPNGKVDEDNPIDPLVLDCGRGHHRSNSRKEADEGMIDDELLEVIKTVDEFKSKNKKPFPHISDFYQIMLFLGYRKVTKRSAHIDYVNKDGSN